ncbi:hypothetical protein ColTof4_00108 [Colletotrichum tofieldiae]|nr:hypothetical protein ColTof3_07305 [Colletotrichum tofieldiae]GKT67685.1 hypothetical protein ColTof4_00108 [Colletotrichum tofieldiae]GKT91359.1 hypothetical protein Ct61P_09209 [Colletotrichum tofieldiae]
MTGRQRPYFASLGSAISACWGVCSEDGIAAVLDGTDTWDVVVAAACVLVSPQGRVLCQTGGTLAMLAVQGVAPAAIDEAYLALQ